MIYTYQHGDQTYALELKALADGAYLAVLDGREVHVEAVPLSDGSWRLLFDGHALTVHTARAGRQRFVQVAGEPAHTLTVPEPRTARRRASTGGGDARLIAQMPGQVVEVYVSTGDPVTAGQTLLVLEAMKMEIRVAAPREGVIGQVLVSKGEIVEREQLLIELA